MGSSLHVTRIGACRGLCEILQELEKDEDGGDSGFDFDREISVIDKASRGIEAELRRQGEDGPGEIFRDPAWESSVGGDFYNLSIYRLEIED